MDHLYPAGGMDQGNNPGNLRHRKPSLSSIEDPFRMDLRVTSDLGSFFLLPNRQACFPRTPGIHWLQIRSPFSHCVSRAFPRLHAQLRSDVRDVHLLFLLLLYDSQTIRFCQ